MAYVYDLNSAYPKAMLDNDFPNPAKLRVNRSVSVKDLTDVMANYEGMATCTVHIARDEPLPVLPFRMDSRLIFPCGNITGSWTFPELRYAIKNSKTEIQNVALTVFAPAIKSPFKEYISHYYELRKNTKNEFEKYYYKLFMNNLYGKLIQRAREEFRFCESEREAREVMKKKKIHQAEIIPCNGGFFLRYETDRLYNHTIACWGAYITSYVRIILHEEMLKHGNDLVYCDTDSIFSKRFLERNSKELGGWKREEKIVTRIRALKDYVYTEFNEETQQTDTKQMLKGVRKNWKQLDPEANVFKGQRMIRTRESFRRVDNLPPGTFIEQIKTLTGDYLKREILANGETKPFYL